MLFEKKRIACCVAVSSFNQEQYVPRMIDGLLGQQTEETPEFPALDVRVFVFDDASTDGTRALYEKFLRTRNRHIHIQKMYNAVNLGVRGNLKRILKFMRQREEPYAMILEGDDWWSDARLLQRRVRVMERAKAEGRQIPMCFNAILLYYEEENYFITHYTQSMLRQDAITAMDLARDNPIANFSAAMWRTDALRALPEDMFRLDFADWFLHFMLAQQGEIAFLHEPMSVYRIHPQGVYSGHKLPSTGLEANGTKLLRYILEKYPDQYEEPLRAFAETFGIPFPEEMCVRS